MAMMSGLRTGSGQQSGRLRGIPVDQLFQPFFRMNDGVPYNSWVQDPWVVQVLRSSQWGGGSRAHEVCKRARVIYSQLFL